MNLGHSLKRVNSLEILMRESLPYTSNNSQQSFLCNQTPHEVSTLGSDKDIQSNTQEDSYPPPLTEKYKTAHFETILQNQRHTELVTKLDRNISNFQAVMTKLHNLEEIFNDMGVKLLSMEAKISLLSQAQAENSDILHRQMFHEARRNCSHHDEKGTPPTVLKKRKSDKNCDEVEYKNTKEEIYVDMADYLKSRQDVNSVGNVHGADWNEHECDNEAVSDLTGSPTRSQGSNCMDVFLFQESM